MTLNPRIAPALAAALEKKGYAALTEVQSAVIAEEADGRDLLVSAQTGSGKTAAFGMAMAKTLLGDDDQFNQPDLPMALIVAPTRELALQVQRELAWLYGEARGQIASCVGGMDPRAERKALERGCHIVVGTPGRLRDHIERGALDMSQLKAVVLDEADEMLDFGFREDLEYILDAAPASRRTLLFSATVPRAIADIARRFQKDALRISTVSERGQHADIEYRALSVAPSDRENAIINVLRYYDAERAIIFCATREAVNRLAARFGNRGFAAVALSGELTQKERTHALQALRDGRARVCVATDVAARGIDLPGLELVIHADLPTNSDVLLHRSGRTGRAGAKGVCAIIVPHTRRGRANRLLRDAKLQAEWAEAPSSDDVRARDRERLMADPILTEEIDEAMKVDTDALLEKFTAEQLAAAFLRARLATPPSAEDLLSGPAAQNDRPERKPRENFKASVWFRLSAGRKAKAEPRWLLPLICRLGHVTKREIGSIQIGETETRFEIDAEHADRFAKALAENGGGENNIRVSPDDGSEMQRAGPNDGPTDARTPKMRHREKSRHRETDTDGYPINRNRDDAAPRSYEDRKPHDQRERDGETGGDRGADKPRYDKKPYEKKAYGDKKPFGDKNPYGDKKPYEKKSFGDKKPYGKKADGDRPFKGKPKPDYDRADSPVGGDDKPWEKKPRADKPDWKKDDKPRRPRADKPVADKPQRDDRPAAKARPAGDLTNPNARPDKGEDSSWARKRKPAAGGFKKKGGGYDKPAGKKPGFKKDGAKPFEQGATLKRKPKG